MPLTFSPGDLTIQPACAVLFLNNYDDYEEEEGEEEEGVNGKEVNVEEEKE